MFSNIDGPNHYSHLNEPRFKYHNHLFRLVVRWACDDTVTHYIYQGRVGDNTREYRGVKERGLHVVSQCWMEAVRFPAANINIILSEFISLKCTAYTIFTHIC